MNTQVATEIIVQDSNKLKNPDKIGKRKKSRFFIIYISKILKQVNPKSGITSNAKQQLNGALCNVSKKITQIISNLTECSSKKTISTKEIENAIKLIFTGDLRTNSLLEGTKSVEKFNEKSTVGSSRQGKAGIIFPPSITEKFLRNFGYSKIMVTSTAPVFLAACLEYLTAEILTLAVQSALNNNRIRITIRDLQLSIQTDSELYMLFDTLKISFLGGGVVPYIHPNLTMKKLKKKRLISIMPGLKKQHRFRPGTVSLREIKKFQKMSNCLTFAKFLFEKMTRSIINEKGYKMKVSKDVFIILQYFIEQTIVSLLHNANMAAIHAGRVKLMPSDLRFICHLNRIYIKEKIKDDSTTIQENFSTDDSSSASDTFINVV